MPRTALARRPPRMGAATIEERAQAVDRLARVVRPLLNGARPALAEEWDRGRAKIDRADFLWCGLVENFVMVQRAAALDVLMRTPGLRARLDIPQLAALAPEQRLAELEAVCRAATVRFPRKTAAALDEALGRIAAAGGLEGATRTLLALPDRDAKIVWLRAFRGVSDKIARNIMMNGSHPEFRAAIAIDERLKTVTEALGLRFRRYDEHEAFYLEAADALGISGWELDRLLFQHTAAVRRGLAA